MVQQVLQVLQDLMVQQAPQATQVHPVVLEEVEHQDLKVLLVEQVLADHWAHQEHLATQDHQVQLDH